MGEIVPVESLEKRSRDFFESVIALLRERNIPRGDSYLENDLEELAVLLREKTGRIKTALQVLDQTDDKTKTLEDLADHIVDVAGYAALCVIWMQVNIDYDVTEFVWSRLGIARIRPEQPK